MVHTYILPIRPRSKERPRFGNGHAYKSKRYRDWQAQFRQALTERYGAPLPFTGPLRLTVLLCYPTKPVGDLDNILGGICDALQTPGARGQQGDPAKYPGVLWLDDSQFIRKVVEWVPSWEKVTVLEVEEVETPAPPPKPRKRKAA